MNLPDARELYGRILELLRRYPDLRQQMGTGTLSWMQGLRS